MYADKIVPHAAVAVGKVKVWPFDFVAGFEPDAAGNGVSPATMCTRAYAVPDVETSFIDEPVAVVEKPAVESAK